MACLVACVLLLAAQPAGAAQDEIVPQGVLLTRIELTTRTDRRAFDHGREEVPLLAYLTDSVPLQGTIEGSVQRETKRTELIATYGMSDTWNLSLHVPYVSVAQSSELSTTSGDPAVLARLESLRERSIGKLGTLQLISLHRPVFSDRHGLVLGYGLEWPAHNPASPWAGRGTLLLDSPFPAGLGLLHYTYYPPAQRTRLDLRFAFTISETRELAMEGGGHESVNPGNQVEVSLDWGQEFGPVATAFGAHTMTHGRSRVAHLAQGDNSSETALRMMLGFGNLTELERHPLAFPYQVELTYDHTLHGAGVPERREFRLGFQSYF